MRAYVDLCCLCSPRYDLFVHKSEYEIGLVQRELIIHSIVLPDTTGSKIERRTYLLSFHKFELNVYCTYTHTHTRTYTYTHIHKYIYSA
jgi:hypothetical protein